MTDAELSSLVAVHVAGYSEVSVDDMEHVDYDARSVAVWKEMRGMLNGERRRVPPYATSADAVLPLLKGYDFFVRAHNDLSVEVTLFKPSQEWEATAGTFPRAACLALLRSKGVEVGE